MVPWPLWPGMAPCPLWPGAAWVSAARVPVSSPPCEATATPTPPASTAAPANTASLRNRGFIDVLLGSVTTRMLRGHAGSSLG